MIRNSPSSENHSFCFPSTFVIQVSDLLHRCTAKQSELERNIQTVETHRHEAHSALQLLREDVSQACHTKVKQLEDNRGVLVEKIDALERSFDEALNVVKSNDEQMIKSICSSVDLVGNARLGCLEADSLVAHTFLCEEIDGLLNEVIDQTSAATIREKAQKQIFKPADDTSLDLGDISEKDVEAALDDMLKGASDDTSAATIGEEAHISEEDITTGLSVPQSKSQPKVCVIKCVDLPEDFEAMTKYTNNSVAITYYYAHYINIFNSDENVRRKYSNIPHDMKCFDLVFQSDMTLCVSTGKTKVHRYSPQGVRESTTKVTSNGHYLRLSRSQSDEILMTNLQIMSPSMTPRETHSNTLCQQQTKSLTRYVQPSRVDSHKFFYRNQGDSPTMVAVYDRNGIPGGIYNLHTVSTCIPPWTSRTGCM